MQAIIDRIISQATNQRPYIVAINGIDASGKSSFALTLSRQLGEKRSVQLVHVDDFHLPRSIRAQCTLTPPECYYRHTFDWNLLEGSLLRPITANSSLNLDLKVLDLATDSYTTERSYRVTADTIVVVEGVFLFQPKLLPYFDFKVYLHIDEDECLQRVTKRDGYLFGDSAAIISRYQQKYLPGQALYIKECSALSIADLVIDNNDYNRPLFTWKS